MLFTLFCIFFFAAVYLYVDRHYYQREIVSLERNVQFWIGQVHLFQEQEGLQWERERELLRENELLRRQLTTGDLGVEVTKWN